MKRTVQPVLDAIARTAARLCEAHDALIHQVEGNELRLIARYGRLRAVRDVGETFPLTRGWAAGRAVIDRKTIHVHDMKRSAEFHGSLGDARARTTRVRTILATPLVYRSTAFGVIVIRRTRVRPFTAKQIALLKTFADQAAIAIENARLSHELESRNRELSDALEQQTATGEIARAISRAPTHVQPVLDAIVQTATTLCGAAWGAAFRLDGQTQTLVAHHGTTPDELALLRRVYPRVADRDRATGRAIVDRRPVNVADLQDDPEYAAAPLRTLGLRSVLAVPLLCDGAPIGALGLWRREPHPFTDKQVEILSTFADQAVIAIENVRLFTELAARNRDLTEALDRQATTADVLRIIAQSPSDLQPVLDAIAASAVRLCAASDAVIERLDGDRFYNAAHAGTQMKELVGRPLPLTRRFPGGRAVLDRRPIIIDDIHLVAASEYPDTLPLLEINTIHSVAEIPLLSEGKALGSIAVLRRDVRPFTEAEVALLQTFADQAVIAIENVRLFRELESRNRELTTALDYQTATADILRVISRSHTDLQAVFQTIVDSAKRLLRGNSSVISRIAGDRIELAAYTRTDAAGDALLESFFPIPLASDGREVRPIRERVIGGREAYNVADVETDARVGERGRANARARGYRSQLVVPMVRDDDVVGTIAVTRAEPGAFTDDEITLLRTFADQAVIAIENVRLFTELEARNDDLTEALEQQTATAEILRLIGTSPTDAQPVFEGIARSAVKVLDALACAVFIIDGDVVSVAATHGVPGQRLDRFRTQFPSPLSEQPEFISTVREGIFHLADIERNPLATREQVEFARLGGYGARLMAPMMRGDSPLGVIAVTRVAPAPFAPRQVELLQTFADQAVIAIENVRLFKELEEKNQALTTAHARVSEALEQQVATSAILTVIASSPTDVQPVLDAVAENAARLCHAEDSSILQVDGEVLRVVAYHGAIRLKDFDGTPVNRGSVAGRAILDGQVVHVHNITEASDAEFSVSRALMAHFGHSTMLATPLLRTGTSIGAIFVRRTRVLPFSDKQIDLLKTFADQAVIAIENVRLFTELEARNRDLTTSLDRQTATSEVLRVISSSPTDVQPVFDAILRSAVRLCNGFVGMVAQADGDLVRLAAVQHPSPAEVAAIFPAPLTSTLAPCRAIRENVVVHVPDVEAAGVVPPEGVRVARMAGMRSLLVVPMRRDDDPIGAILVSRPLVGSFTDDQTALLQTFADQAVIALENVRLFKELEVRNRDLTEALEQQTATSEILRVIASSPTDLQPVLDAVSASAARLCEASDGVILLVEGSQLRAAAHHGQAFAAAVDRPVTRDGVAGRAVIDRATIHVPDVQVADDFPLAQRLSRADGSRTVLATPLMREEVAVGAILIRRAEVRPFSDQQIGLLKTFADQAVIAIENVRLFHELQARTAQLTRSVGELTALGEVSRALSSTLDLETVLSTIVARAVQLAGTDGCSIYEYDEDAEQFHVRATHNLEPEIVEVLRARPIRRGQGALGQLAEAREPIQIPDIRLAGTYSSHLREVLLRLGHRALMAVPLLQDDRLVGGLTVNKKTPGEFPAEIVELLKTFATQSALAINNARLFREIEDKSRQLEIASQHKSQFLANMSHELRTPLNAILGYTELIADGIYGEVPERMREVLERVDKSGRHLLGLINDILDLSKIEAGQLTLALGPYAMDGVAQTVATQIGGLAAEKQLGFELALADDLPIGQGDERRLTQVLLNLVGNAIKFTDVGKVVVRVSMEADAYVVSVTDTGPGIAEADREKIFEEFQQADTTRAKAKGGTGLGLAISRRIVEMHGGRLWVESTLGAGSTFAFTVPVNVEHQVAVARQGEGP